MSTTKKPKVPPLLIDLPTVAQVAAMSESMIQRLVREGNFPQPRQLSGRRVGWLMREVEAWAESLPVSTLPPPPNTGASKPRTAGAAT